MRARISGVANEKALVRSSIYIKVLWLGLNNILNEVIIDTIQLQESNRL